MGRFLIIAAIVLAVLGLGAGAYYYFFMRPTGVAVAPGGSANLPVAGQGTAPTTGTNAPSTGGSGTPSSGTSSSAPVVVSSRLVKISGGPVVPGEVVVTKKATASSSPDTLISFIARESGNVYTYSPITKTLTRTSNKTIPGIQSASWLPDGSTAFVRYLSGDDFSTINTYALPANGSGGFFLPQNLSDISVSSTSILALASGVNGSTATLERTDGSHAVTVFSTPLSMVRASFAGKSQYAFFTKPSVTLQGDAFLVDAAGHITRIAGPRNGLVALTSPLGKWVLVSYTLAGAMQMELVNAATGEVLSLPIATIADKCVWTPDDLSIYCGVPQNPPPGVAYPDDWYQGAVQFSDRIWKIQVVGRYAQLVLDFPKEAKASLDAEALAIDSISSVLTFVNKNDFSLWSYQL